MFAKTIGRIAALALVLGLFTSGCCHRNAAPETNGAGTPGSEVDDIPYNTDLNGSGASESVQ